MFCAKCGKKNEEDAIFCEACGNRLESEEVQSPAKPNYAPSQRVPESKTDSTGKKLDYIILGLAVVIIAAIVIGVIFFLFNRFSSKQDDTDEIMVKESQELEEDNGEDTENSTQDISNEEDLYDQEEEIQTDSDVQSDTEEIQSSGGDYIFPDSSNTYLTEAQVSGLSESELRYARNEIYARHGRKFSDADLQAYFNAKSWYTPIYEGEEFDQKQDTIFNDYEKTNVKLIASVEEAKGYQ